MKAAVIALALVATGCTVKASHALMGAGLMTAAGGVVVPEREGALRPTTISVGLAVFALGWILHQADHPDRAPMPGFYAAAPPPTEEEKLRVYRSLPTDHALFTR